MYVKTVELTGSDPIPQYVIASIAESDRLRSLLHDANDEFPE